MINLMSFQKTAFPVAAGRPASLKFKGEGEENPAPATAPKADSVELTTAQPTAPTQAAAEAAPQASGFTRAEALDLLSVGLIQQFNERIAQWREQHPDPKEFFDLKDAKIGQLLNSAKAISTVNPNTAGETMIDFIGVDLRGADFRGLDVLEALFTEEAEDGQLTGPRDTLLEGAHFSPTTLKIVT